MKKIMSLIFVVNLMALPALAKEVTATSPFPKIGEEKACFEYKDRKFCYELALHRTQGSAKQPKSMGTLQLMHVRSCDIGERRYRLSGVTYFMHVNETALKISKPLFSKAPEVFFAPLTEHQINGCIEFETPFCNQNTYMPFEPYGTFEASVFFQLEDHSVRKRSGRITTKGFPDLITSQKICLYGE